MVGCWCGCLRAILVLHGNNPSKENNMNTLIPAFPMKYENFGGTMNKQDLTKGQVDEFRTVLTDAYPTVSAYSGFNEVSDPAATVFKEAWDFADTLPAVEWEYERLANTLNSVLRAEGV